MLQESSVKPRKGTKSCLDCRHRKVRCVWPTEGAARCRSCIARDRTCEQQVERRPTSDTVTSTTRVRIAQLERTVVDLGAAVQELQAKLDGSPVATLAPTQPQPAQELSPQATTSSPQDEDEDDDGTGLDFSEGSPTATPTHLQPLFDNTLLGAGSYDFTATASHVSNSHHPRGSTALRNLLPLRADMVFIAERAYPWLNLYNSLFPTMTTTQGSKETLALYGNAQKPDASPVDIAELLLTVALTIQQEPEYMASRMPKSVEEPLSFVKAVCDTVERYVVNDDDLAATLEGASATLTYELSSRLCQGKIRKYWLLLRRTIALASIIGMPRAAMSVAAYQVSPISTRPAGVTAASYRSAFDRRQQKAELWEMICAIDRIGCMMWSLPVGTADYPLPKRSILDAEGHVVPQSYLYRLADAARRVSELDSRYSSGRLSEQPFDIVLSIDQELRSIAMLTPQNWWKTQWSEISIDAVLQYWHQYLIVRTHLQLALAYDESQRFAFNFITCTTACGDLAKRYVSLRQLLPPGFFANNIVDFQAFTAITFLLLISHRAASGVASHLQVFDIGQTATLIDNMSSQMESSADQPGGSFARQAAAAVRSLRSLLDQRQPSQPQSITLNLPLIGKIHVSRKPQVEVPPPTEPPSDIIQPVQGSWWMASSEGLDEPMQNLAPGPADGMMDYLSYSFEIPEDYHFLPDDGVEQWQTWTGMSNDQSMGH